MGWMIHDDLKPLAAEYAKALLARWPDEDRAALLARVGNALRSSEITSRLHPDFGKER